MSKSPIPSANIEEGTLLCLITEKGEGFGRFPRALSKEENDMLLGSTIRYFEIQYYCFREQQGSSQPWERERTYKLEIMKGPYKGFCLEEIVLK